MLRHEDRMHMHDVGPGLTNEAADRLPSAQEAGLQGKERYTGLLTNELAAGEGSPSTKTDTSCPAAACSRAISRTAMFTPLTDSGVQCTSPRCQIFKHIGCALFTIWMRSNEESIAVVHP